MHISTVATVGEFVRTSANEFQYHITLEAKRAAINSRWKVNYCVFMYSTDNMSPSFISE